MDLADLIGCRLRLIVIVEGLLYLQLWPQLVLGVNTLLVDLKEVWVKKRIQLTWDLVVIVNVDDIFLLLLDVDVSFSSGIYRR